MNFYSILSKYYDEVFPVKEAMIDFITKNKMGDKILDVGCGNGKLDVTLGNKGVEVLGIDLDEEMIDKARGFKSIIKPEKKVDFKVMDMKNISEVFKEEFSTVICLGNTLVHLKDRDEIKEAINNMRASLKEDGAVIIQIINYNRIFKDDIKELPLLETENVLFKREYHLNKSEVKFKTTIFDKNTKEEYRNEIKLFPLLKEEVEEVLMECGFKTLEFYGDYKANPYSEKSYHTIVVARI